jgi:excisionase family DNA binding protein
MGLRGGIMTALALTPVQPDESDISTAVEALPHVTSYLAEHSGSVIRLVVADDPEGSLVVPRSALELLAQVLAHMAAGQGVSVVPAHAELTTQQAAELLNVSRPFLIRLLDAGEIDYRKVGKHRRIKAQSLMAYVARDDQERRRAADELTRFNQEMGLL